MTVTAADQLRRILHLVPRLGDGAEHPMAELAEREGVSVSTLNRDLQAIANRFDEPGGFVEGVQIYIEQGNVSLFTSHFLRPMRLTTAELLALELGLAMLRAERPAEEHACLDRARERLRATIAQLPGASSAPGTAADPTAGPPGLHADPAGSGDVGQLASLRTSRSLLRKVRILYRRGGSEVASDRVVHPYALAAVRGCWYLVGHCERAGSLRIFRMDRVEGVEPLPTSFAIPRDFSLEDVLRDGDAFATDRSGTLRIRYSSRIARWIEERHSGTRAADGSYVVEHPMADDDWGVRHVLQYGADAEVLEPRAIREAIVERLRALAGE